MRDRDQIYEQGLYSLDLTKEDMPKTKNCDFYLNDHYQNLQM